MVEGYLPHIYAIIECVTSGDLRLRQKAGNSFHYTIFRDLRSVIIVVFSWRSTFSANLLDNSPRQSVVGLFADLAFTLITYASALSNFAATSVASLGAYEIERAITDAERKQKDDSLNSAVKQFLKASGIFLHVAEKVIPRWEESLVENAEDQERTSASNVRPIDLNRELVSALSR